MTPNLGVAIAIPRPFADELEGWRDRFGDPAAHLIQAHVTLLPPTKVKDVAAVERHLAAVARRHEAFPVVLQGTGTFRPVSPVVYVRVASGAREITTMEADVRSGPLGRSLRFEYHPHVTIAHDLPEAVLTVAQQTLADYEAAFTADCLTLYEQSDDGVWAPLREFFLLDG